MRTSLRARERCLPCATDVFSYGGKRGGNVQRVAGLWRDCAGPAPPYAPPFRELGLGLLPLLADMLLNSTLYSG